MADLKNIFRSLFYSARRPLRAVVLIMLFLATVSRAVEITGGDWHGGDLTPPNYATLRGTFINVGSFTINNGDTVFVAQGVPLVIYASTVTINGKLDATGRGLPGGIGGDFFLPGTTGFGAGPGGIGGGSGGTAEKGGGGGGHADADLDGTSGGSGAGGAAGGAQYASTDTISAPMSPDDISMGSGGGGGGGGNDADQTVSGSGGAGGGSIYIEALYVNITGTVTARGLDGGSGINPNSCTVNPGGGGGGSGGSVLIKALKTLAMTNSYVASDGGLGGYAVCSAAGSIYPGGGGAAGRITLLYRAASFTQTVISTSAGSGGTDFPFFSNFGGFGSSGTVSYGLVPSSPSGFAVQQVFKTSAAYSWDQKDGPEWGGAVAYLPAPAIYQFRLYESTPALPLDAYYRGIAVSSAAVSLVETGLTPDTTIYRMLTAYTDLGNSAPSGLVSTHTSAAAPLAQAGSAFAAVSRDSISFSWSSGTASGGFNPAHTLYEISRSTNADFSADVSTSFIVAASSAASGLLPDTTYYFRARALGINGVYTEFTPALSTPTLAATPVSPAFTGVYVDSIAFSWSGALNPQGTLFEAQLSGDINFLSLSASTRTLLNSADFTGLNPGVIYYLRVRALNRALRPTDFTLPISTTVGQLGNFEAPSKPEPPVPAAAYSYDGSAVFNWNHPSGVMPYRYWLEIGDTPGGSDFLSSYPVLASAPLTYSTNTLVSGKTYYARVRAESAAGVLGEFSGPGPGIAVWIPAAQTPVVKPYNWPNPFDPAREATNIGFNLSAPCEVTLKIFTLQGILVHEEKRSEPGAGNKVWQWSGRNDEGRMVEPGGYICLVIKKYSDGTKVQKFKIAVLY